MCEYAALNAALHNNWEEEEFNSKPIQFKTNSIQNQFNSTMDRSFAQTSIDLCDRWILCDTNNKNDKSSNLSNFRFCILIFFLIMCENNWVRKIARVTREDRRRMVELREETGVQKSLTERLVRGRLVGWTRRKDGGWQTTEESGRVTWARQEETREVKAEMGGLC